MSGALYVIVFIFGTIVGSFLNVVILRYNTGTSFLGGRSFCFSCGKKLSWYELVPIVSFVILRGRCHACGAKISYQYPLVEIATGLLFLLTIFNFQFSIFKIGAIVDILYYWIIWSILIVISVYDLRHKIIPDLLAFLFAVLSLTHLVATVGIGKIFHTPHSWDIFAGPLFALPFAALWFFSKGRWMGLGDAKLALGIGWFLGLIKGGTAIILGFWMGAVVGLSLIAASKLPLLKAKGDIFSLQSEIPFGPFLVLGTVIAYFYNINVFDLGFVLF